MNPKLPITSAAFLLLPVFLSAQLSWNRVGGTTRDVAFASDSIVIAVGDGGKVLRSTDAGRTWRQPVVPTSEHLLAVDFVMEGPGMAVGEKGRVLTTSDGGHQWRKAPVPFSVELRDIDVVSPRLAFAVGDQGTILSSTDGGLRWDLLQSGISLTLTGVHFVDPKHGLVVGANGTMLRTTDGGDSWTSVLIPTSYYLSGVEFLDSMRGVAFGIQGTILHTSDGGATWTDISLVSSRAISAAIYTDTATIAVVSGSLILRSTDQGRTWNEHDVRDSLEQPLRDFEGQIDPLRPELHGIAGSQRNAVAVGSDGLIFSSDDAVRTWSTRSFIPLSGLTRNFYIAGFQILDSLNWVGTSWPGKFYRTTDAGATWTFKQVSQYQEYFEAIHFTSRDSGIILTDGGVLGTDNGGRSWRSLVSGISGSTTRELAFIEGYTSYIVDKEAVRRTADGGWSWDSLYAVPGRSIPLSILFLDQEQGLLIYNDYDDSLDYHGTTVVRTDDSGESWSTVLFPSPMSNARLHAGISDDVWITGNILQGGSTARMLRSTDAGRSWDSVDLTFGTSGISDI